MNFFKRIIDRWKEKQEFLAEVEDEAREIRREEYKKEKLRQAKGEGRELAQKKKKEQQKNKDVKPFDVEDLI